MPTSVPTSEPTSESTSKPSSEPTSIPTSVPAAANDEEEENLNTTTLTIADFIISTNNNEIDLVLKNFADSVKFCHYQNRALISIHSLSEQQVLMDVIKSQYS